MTRPTWQPCLRFHHICLLTASCFRKVACERRSSINSGAWLRRFDDITRVEKSCVAKGINRTKAKEKYFIIKNKYALPPNI